MRALRFAQTAVPATLASVLLAAPLRACPGDCDGDGAVAIHELVAGVGMAVHQAPAELCASLDANRDGRVTVDELLAGIAAALGGCPLQPILPPDYRDTFLELANCRLSIEHGGVSVRVMGNILAAQPYLEQADSLPVGSVVVKEEFAGPNCVDANFRGWTVMRKEPPGFDPADADWHWQRLGSDRSVQCDDKNGCGFSCIGCHVRPDCRARDYMCTHIEARGRLTQVLSGLPAALLSITGTSSNDVYAVGADPGDGFGPYLLRYDGTRWRRLNTGATGDLWWISVTPIGGAFYMAGENGLILRYDPATGEIERQATPGNALLFGIWGTDPRHIWAVGGDPENEDAGGVVWRYDGVRWVADADLARIRPEGIPTLYKVWGRSENEVYASGRLGVVFLFDGVRWSQLENRLTRPLFTIHGNDSLVAAVGGIGDGVIVEREGSSMVDRTVRGAPQMNGIFVPPRGAAVTVGVAGSLALRTSDGWELRNTGLNTILDFHSVWVDPEGGIWAVGGNLASDLNQGLLAYGGTRTIGSEFVDIDPCPPGDTGGALTVSYANEIVPLFAANGCLAANCHGGTFPASGYDMRSYARMFRPGSIARSLGLCEIVPGNPEASFLFEKLIAAPRFGVQMPINLPPLSASDIELVRTWILEGAQYDGPPTPSGVTPTRAPTPTRTPTRPGATPPATPPAVCAGAGMICTMAGTGLSLFDGDGKAARHTSLYQPFDVVFDRDGNPLVLDWNNLRVRRIGGDGIVATIMGNDFEAAPVEGALAADTSLHHASDIELDSDGSLYVAGNHAPVVFRIGTDDRVRIVAGREDESGYSGDGGPAREATLTAPFGVFPTGDGGFYLADSAAHVVRHVDPAGIIRTVAGTGPIPGTRAGGYSGDGGPASAAQLNGPTRVRADGEGNLFICDTNNHAIRKVDPAGIITTLAGTGTAGFSGDGGPADRARLNTPYDLRLGPDGAVYVADSGNNVIRRIDPHGLITTVIGTGRAGFTGDEGHAISCQLRFPVGLELGPDGSLWISDTFNHRVRRVAGFLR